ncbi:MAG TPA: zinc ABC transporter substrate-binding protein [Gaiellaceae bacterium]|nr:zinc ABC transporter substrate-binding protein [Gaiellaceae bacterium]
MAGLAASCGSSAPAETLAVVASTNVYGNLVAQIGGAHVTVTSILGAPDADPHLFDPGARTGLAVATAGLAVQNGAGYDDFMERLERAAPSGRRVVVSVADALGAADGANPHLWYDVPRLPAVARALADGLVAADPSHAAAYRAGLRRLLRSLAPLEREVARIRARFAGAPVAYTESVAGYLVGAAGLRNLAPPEFTRALEEGNAPPPAAVLRMEALVRDRRVRVLLYDAQAPSPLTVRLRDAARAAGVAVVAVTETLPPGRTFEAWQLAQARTLERALS